MAGWLIPLLRVGGTPVAAVIAVILMGRWLWAKIDKGLNSYTTAYLQQKAAIDARIERLEQLAEEQARLTRTLCAKISETPSRPAFSVGGGEGNTHEDEGKWYGSASPRFGFAWPGAE